MNEEKRIYVVIPATVQVPVDTIVQPMGRQIAQACHVVSKLRYEAIDWNKGPINPDFVPLTTIIKQARDSKELWHISDLLRTRGFNPAIFEDENKEVYGYFHPATALAVLMMPSQATGILDYLPLWGS